MPRERREILPQLPIPGDGKEGCKKKHIQIRQRKERGGEIVSLRGRMRSAWNAEDLLSFLVKKYWVPDSKIARARLGKEKAERRGCWKRQRKRRAPWGGEEEGEYMTPSLAIPIITKGGGKNPSMTWHAYSPLYEDMGRTVKGSKGTYQIQHPKSNLLKKVDVSLRKAVEKKKGVV